MLGSTTPFAAAALAVLMGTAAFAQETAPAAPPAATPAAPPTAPAPAPDAATTTPVAPVAPAAPDAATGAANDCAGQFTALDSDSNGFLSETEAPREYARTRIDAVTLQPTGISQDEFMRLCDSEQWSSMTPEEGAPFEGANSFTEEQAKDRALAWNVTDVSALVQDANGIWRGTGKVNDAAVDVAVDYKGNVVTTPAS